MITLNTQHNSTQVSRNLRNPENKPAFSGTVAKATGTVILGVPRALFNTNKGNFAMFFTGLATMAATGTCAALAPLTKIIIATTSVVIGGTSGLRYLGGCTSSMREEIIKGAKAFDAFSNKSPNVSELPRIIKNGIKKLIKK